MRIFTIITFFLPFIGLAQVGGVNTYQLLNATTNPRTAALGGTSVSIADGDVTQFFENPAVLDSVRSKDLFVHLNPYFVDLTVFNGAYTFDTGSWGEFAIGLSYLDYNNFDQTDASGNIIGTFSAEDYIIVLGKTHQLGPITIGLNAKLIHSSIDNVGSTAILGDVGGIFRINKNWTVGLVISNLGGSVTNYNELVEAEIPLDVKLGTTFKPEYMPLRFTITSSNLSNTNFIEESESEGRSNKSIEKVLRRMNLGAELLLSKNFNVLVGYNHKRKQELKLDEIGGGAGFSYGFMIKIKRFQFRFSRATYHAAGGSSFLSLQTNLNDFKRIL